MPVWERDKLYIWLALNFLAEHHGRQNDAAVSFNDISGWLKRHIDFKKLPESDDKQFCLGLWGDRSVIKIRNQLRHFNLLATNQPLIKLTDLVNDVRKLVSYDRKLKNAVSKSVITLMEQEGFELRWQMHDHQLTDAQVTGGKVTHFKKNKWPKGPLKSQYSQRLTENKHSNLIINMLRKLFANE